MVDVLAYATPGLAKRKSWISSISGLGWGYLSLFSALAFPILWMLFLFEDRANTRATHPCDFPKITLAEIAEFFGAVSSVFLSFIFGLTGWFRTRKDQRLARWLNRFGICFPLVVLAGFLLAGYYNAYLRIPWPSPYDFVNRTYPGRPIHNS